MRLEQAVNLANMCHNGVKDKAGLPYISHPLRVASRFLDEDHMIVAMLHDVLEDTTCTANDLLFVWGFSGKVVDAVVAISRGPKETWKQYIRRCKKNEIARMVKLADLEDNVRPDRARLPEMEAQRKMYFWAIGELENQG